MPKTKAFVSKTDWRYDNPFEVARWNIDSNYDSIANW